MGEVRGRTRCNGSRKDILKPGVQTEHLGCLAGSSSQLNSRPVYPVKELVINYYPVKHTYHVSN